jgi:hypothetical protein
MKCHKEGCDEKAHWQLGWKAYALGYPTTTSQLVQSFISIAVCDKHKEDVGIHDLITPEGAAIINESFTKQGVCPLDFTTAELLFHPVIGEKLYMGPDGEKPIVTNGDAA